MGPTSVWDSSAPQSLLSGHLRLLTKSALVGEYSQFSQFLPFLVLNNLLLFYSLIFVYFIRTFIFYDFILAPSGLFALIFISINFLLTTSHLIIMHSSAVVALALVAAAGPAFAAPASRASWSRRQTAPSTGSADASGAIDTKLIGDIVEIGNGLINGANGIEQFVKG